MFSFESTGGVGLGNKKIYIQENDTSYHISEIWDGMENFFTGFHYFYLNDSCYHYVEDSVDQSFMSFGSLDEGNKKIWVREVDSTYTFCVSKSDKHWTIIENKETGHERIRRIGVRPSRYRPSPANALRCGSGSRRKRTTGLLRRNSRADPEGRIRRRTSGTLHGSVHERLSGIRHELGIDRDPGRSSRDIQPHL